MVTERLDSVGSVDGCDADEARQLLAAARVQVSLARLWQERGRLDRAQAALLRALELQPDHPVVREARERLGGLMNDLRSSDVSPARRDDSAAAAGPRASAADDRVPFELTPSELDAIVACLGDGRDGWLTLVFCELLPDHAADGEADSSPAWCESLASLKRSEFARLAGETFDGEGAGRVIARPGDGLLVAFADPVAALAQALRLQRNLARWSTGRPAWERLPARIGINSGRHSEGVGAGAQVINRIAYSAGRAVESAWPGQILLTGAARAGCRGAVDGDSLYPIQWAMASDQASHDLDGDNLWEVSNCGLVAADTEPLQSTLEFSALARWMRGPTAGFAAA